MNIFLQSPLFAGLDGESLSQLFACLKARERSFQRGEFLFSAGDAAGLVGVVVSGLLHILQEDYWGNRTILTHLGPGDLFGEAFSCAGLPQFPVSALAVEPSRVLLFPWQQIATPCAKACDFHLRINQNMMQILARKNVMLTGKLQHLSKRTTREKILSYLSSLALSSHSREITIPFNRQEMADYLSMDRSALSRELSLMQREGLLTYNRNHFSLGQNPYGE